jgi:hypothetical protein
MLVIKMINPLLKMVNYSDVLTNKSLIFKMIRETDI